VHSSIIYKDEQPDGSNIIYMSTSLIIGGSSQAAFYVIKNLLALGEFVIATHRSEERSEQRLSQLTSSKVNLNNYVSVICEEFGTQDLIDLIYQYSISSVYYLSAVNISSSNTKMSDSNISEMQKVHIRDALSVLNAIKAIPDTRGLFTLSSKMFRATGEVDEIITIDSIPNPENYYGQSKNEAWDYIKRYRESFGCHVSATVLFNYESNYRLSKAKDSFLIPTLTRKILHLKWNMANKIDIKDFSQRQDWSHAADICNSIVAVGKSISPMDFVIGSGYGQSINEIILEALRLINDDELSDKCIRVLPNEIPFRPCVVSNNSAIDELMGPYKRHHVAEVISEEYLRLVKKEI
jgi:GDP-D-mannose dehydratase